MNWEKFIRKKIATGKFLLSIEELIIIIKQQRIEAVREALEKLPTGNFDSTPYKEEILKEILKEIK